MMQKRCNNVGYTAYLNNNVLYLKLAEEMHSNTDLLDWCNIFYTGSQRNCVDFHLAPRSMIGSHTQSLHCVCQNITGLHHKVN